MAGFGRAGGAVDTVECTDGAGTVRSAGRVRRREWWRWEVRVCEYREGDITVMGRLKGQRFGERGSCL